MLIVIPGKPFAKQRPRATRQGHVFTPKETVRFEQAVAAIAAETLSAPLVGPVRVTIQAFFEPPASWPRKRRLRMRGQPHVQRPYLDNIVKAITAGLNRIAYADDGQIAVVMARKLWGAEAKTTVQIEPLCGTTDAR